MADAARLRHVAEIITDTYKAGNQVVAVLSAQGDTTDELIEKANEINPLASNREMDMLLSTGEQMSVALCAMAVEALGYPVISLTGWQAGMVTNTVSRNARIKKVDTERIETELNQKKIVIVTGFQGINRYEDIKNQAATEEFFRFLVEQGLLEPEQAGSPLLIKELKKTFWGFAQHLDMNGSGRITPELSQELLERMNQAILRSTPGPETT